MKLIIFLLPNDYFSLYNCWPSYNKVMPINVIYISDLLKLRIRIKGIVSKLNLSENL